jgi:non-lysosomal glucosylceramidase
MSAYSVFLAVTGYDYHGPKGRLGFAPKLSPENFRAAFTAAEGWGTFSQVISSSSMTVEIQLAYGQLTLNAVVLEVPGNPGTAQAKLNGTFYPTQIIPSSASQQVTIQFNQPVVIQAGQTFTINISV